MLTLTRFNYADWRRGYVPIWDQPRACDCWKQTAPICDECKADQARRAELKRQATEGAE